MSQKSSESTRRRSGCGLVLVALIFVLLVVPLASLLIWQMQTSRRARLEIERLQASGAPTSGAELDGYYALKDGQRDVTQAWLRPLRELEESMTADSQSYEGLPLVSDGPEIPRVGNDWDQLEEVETWLNSQQEVLTQLHAAAEADGQVRYPVNLNKGLAALLSHAQQIRNAARVLALESEMHAHRGEPAGTARAIRTTLELARTLEREPLFVSQLVRFAVDGITLDQLARHLGRLPFTDEQLRAMQQELEQTDYQEALQHALVGERAITVQAMRDPASAGLPTNSVQAILPRGDDICLTLKLYEDMLSVTDQPYFQAKPTLDRVDGEMVQRTSSTVGRLRFPLTATLLPSIQSVFQARARVRAQRRAAITALAIERFRLRHGRVPATLGELVPEFLTGVPVDPYDGQPLRYLADDDGFTIYSVGANLADDGGLDDPGRSDEVFRVQERAAER